MLCTLRILLHLSKTPSQTFFKTEVFIKKNNIRVALDNYLNIFLQVIRVLHLFLLREIEIIYIYISI